MKKILIVEVPEGCELIHGTTGFVIHDPTSGANQYPEFKELDLHDLLRRQRKICGRLVDDDNVALYNGILDAPEPNLEEDKG